MKLTSLPFLLQKSLKPEPELLDASSPSSVAPLPVKGLVQPDVEATARASQAALRLAAAIS
jgi:hypothetical protein